MARRRQSSKARRHKHKKTNLIRKLTKKILGI